MLKCKTHYIQTVEQKMLIKNAYNQPLKLLYAKEINLSEQVLYSDKLVEIKGDEILFHKYYFPTLSDKKLKYSEVEKIEIVQPTIKNGKFRYWGTGDFLHWFPVDNLRSKRNVIYILHKKNKRIRVGFTVENSELVIEILKQKVSLHLN